MALAGLGLCLACGRFGYDEILIDANGSQVGGVGDAGGVGGDESNSAGRGGVSLSDGGAGAGQSGAADAGEGAGGSGAQAGAGQSGAADAGESAGGSGAQSGASAGGASAAAGASGSETAGGAAGAPSVCVPTQACSCETHGGHEYKFCDAALFQVDAQADCAASGMSLVRIDDQTENDWLRDTATAKGLLPIEPFVFIGATDTAVEGEWRWTDGEQFWSGSSSGSTVGGLYANWGTNRPQSSRARNCAGMINDGRWEDRSCTALSHYVCESGP